MTTSAWTLLRGEYRTCVGGNERLSRTQRSTLAPRQLWRSIDTLMGLRHASITGAVSADDMHHFFDMKVAGVRTSTTDAPSPSFTAAPLGCVLRVFRPLTVIDVVAAVRALPDKECMFDPLPTHVFKHNVDVMAPFLVEVMNRSLVLGVVPSVFKSAYITPLLKKADLDPDDANSY